ncbi:MAG: hypothetical protein L6Q95_11795 [Planctomycetes bacterium]|nr:hypothetical protein [Planctomycetota bacterium]
MVGPLRRAAILVLAAAAWAGDEVVVSDTELGCEGEEEDLAYRFVREGDFYVRGAVRIPASHLATLRRLALDAPGIPEALPEELGVTRARLKEMEHCILEAALRGLEEYVPSEIPEGLEHLVSFEAVAKAARETFLDPDLDTDYTELRLTLPGDPPVTIRTASEAPWAQPWFVKVGDGEERVAVSIELAKAAALFVDARGPSAQHLDGARYWREEFWRDDGLWRRHVGQQLIEHHAKDLCAGLAGWEEALRRARVTEATIGFINMPPFSLFVKLDCTGGGLIDSIRWWNVYDGTELGYDGDDLVQALDAAEQAAKGLPFLKAWKAADPGRRITIDIVGRTGHAETNLRDLVEPAWKDSGLEGSPDFELTLRSSRSEWSSIWLSAASKGALLLDADETFPDAKGIRFHPKTPEYAVISPDGKVTRRKLRG